MAPWRGRGGGAGSEHFPKSAKFKEKIYQGCFGVDLTPQADIIWVGGGNCGLGVSFDLLMSKKKNHIYKRRLRATRRGFVRSMLVDP